MRTSKYWLLFHSSSNSRFVKLTGEIEKRIDWRKMDVWILSVCVWHTVYKYTYNLSRSRRIYFPFIFYTTSCACDSATSSSKYWSYYVIFELFSGLPTTNAIGATRRCVKSKESSETFLHASERRHGIPIFLHLYVYVYTFH